MNLMKTALFFTFLFSIAKSSLLVCIGILVKSHLNKIVIKYEEKIGVKDEKILKLINWIGIIIIILGLTLGIQALITWIISLQIPNTVRPMLLNK